MSRNALISAFGETKRASEWVKDYRCVLDNADTLSIRINEMGWDAELALTKAFTKRKKINFDDFSFGKKYGFFTCTGVVKNVKHKYHAECICECGIKKLVAVTALYYKQSKSCGCKKGLDIIHGKSNSFNGKKHPVYNTWTSMKYRCYNKNNESYKNYGAVGIYVCKEWRESFINFYNWAIKNGWKKGLTLERVNVLEGYNPSNCCWITRSKQQANKRTSVFLTAFGERKCLQYWAADDRCVISATGLRNRINNGWEHEKAIITKSCRK